MSLIFIHAEIHNSSISSVYLEVDVVAPAVVGAAYGVTRPVVEAARVVAPAVVGPACVVGATVVGPVWVFPPATVGTACVVGATVDDAGA